MSMMQLGNYTTRLKNYGSRLYSGLKRYLPRYGQGKKQPRQFQTTEQHVTSPLEPSRYAQTVIAQNSVNTAKKQTKRVTPSLGSIAGGTVNELFIYIAGKGSAIPFTYLATTGLLGVDALTMGSLGLIGVGLITQKKMIHLGEGLFGTKNPWWRVHAQLMNVLRARFMTPTERLTHFYHSIITKKIFPITDAPTDIINEPFFEGNQTILQILLQYTFENEYLETENIMRLIACGAEPNKHEPGTVHPITLAIQHKKALSTILALINPYIVNAKLKPLPSEIVQELQHFIQIKRKKILDTLRQNTDLKTANAISITSEMEVKAMESLLMLDEIHQTLKNYDTLAQEEAIYVTPISEL
jgi:hypothetical protein